MVHLPKRYQNAEISGSLLSVLFQKKSTIVHGNMEIYDVQINLVKTDVCFELLLRNDVMT